MIYTMGDITRLLTHATPDERTNLAKILDVKLEETASPQQQAEEIIRKICWRYQTPLGYLTREPTFDEICVDVAKALKLEGLANQQRSCWSLLEEIVRTLLTKMYEQSGPDQREAMARDLLSEDQLKELLDGGPMDWGKLNFGGLLLAINEFGGFAVYKVALIVANQAARALMGRGLTLAANAMIARTIGVFLGPVGWVLFVWGINDLLGTNRKRVIPAVFVIFCVYTRLKGEGKLPF